ncbi:probable C-terminal domain small phosphatase [Selaginella moellendorffii]|nr:probable C-terminal domain small phosphatase [Selaginella moellendorffii]|eukprot:XP_002982913.2 probable C-terminal domain small phosphatase [Selaginella moellendorffii]
MPLLQEQRPEHRSRATLVLDLDHTLVHGEVQRPGLDEFLDQMSALYEIVLFTAGPQELAEQWVTAIDKGRFAFILYGNSCVSPKVGVNHKILKDLGRDMARVVVVDDTPSTYKYNQENALPITPFYRGDDTDQELLALIPFLASIAHSEDLRLELCKRKGYTNSTTSATIVNKKEKGTVASNKKNKKKP